MGSNLVESLSRSWRNIARFAPCPVVECPSSDVSLGDRGGYGTELPSNLSATVRNVRRSEAGTCSWRLWTISASEGWCKPNSASSKIRAFNNRQTPGLRLACRARSGPRALPIDRDSRRTWHHGCRRHFVVAPTEFVKAVCIEGNDAIERLLIPRQHMTEILLPRLRERVGRRRVVPGRRR
jgi:hypothetical protein